MKWKNCFISMITAIPSLLSYRGSVDDRRWKISLIVCLIVSLYIQHVTPELKSTTDYFDDLVFLSSTIRGNMNEIACRLRLMMMPQTLYQLIYLFFVFMSMNARKEALEWPFKSLFCQDKDSLECDNICKLLNEGSLSKDCCITVMHAI